MSEAIQNAAAVPTTAKNPKEATDFVRFILSSEGQAILASPANRLSSLQFARAMFLRM